MIKTQYRTFWSQNLSSVIIYVPILLATAWVINYNHDWVYQQTVILDNFEFNVTIALVIFIGVASLALSYKPNCIQVFLGAKERRNKMAIPKRKR